MSKNSFFNTLFTIIFISIAVPLAAQNNPFEIQDRLQSVTAGEIEEIAILDTVELSPRETLELTNQSNPFEVSHIPLRKTNLKNEKKRNFNNTKSQESFLDENYALIFLTICIFIFALILSQNRTLMKELFSSLLNNSSLNLLQRKYDNGWSITGLLLYLIFIFNIALFLCKIFEPQSFLRFIIIVGILAVIYLFKHLFIRLSGQIFPISDVVRTVNFTVYMQHALVGILMILVNVFIYFSYSTISQSFIYIGFSIIVLNFLYRWLKGVFVSSQILTNQPFHFFIYLCSFEILPWIVGYKILSSGTYF